MSPIPSTTVLDSSGHPPVETISDYLEELLPAGAAEELRAHLADCAECLDTHDALEEIRSLLGQADTPRMPADVAARIDAALAAEAVLSATAAAAAPSAGQPGASATAPVTAPPLAAASRPPRGPKGATGPTANRPRSGSRSRQWRRALFGLAALALVGIAGSAVLQQQTGTSSNGSAAAGPAERSTVKAADLAPFTSANLAQQVQGMLSTPHSATAGTGMHPQAQLSAASVPQCVLSAPGRADTPLAVRSGSYQGAAVYAVVYADRTDPGHTVDAYLVDPSCASSPNAAKDYVLLTQAVPRQ